MPVYNYRGPVYKWGNLIETQWEAQTTASSPSQARNQLQFRYKKDHDMAAIVKLTIDPKKLKEKR